MKRNSLIIPQARKVNGIRIFGHNMDVDDADGEIHLWPLKQQKTFASVDERLYISSTDAGDNLLVAIEYIDSDGNAAVGTVTTNGLAFVDTGLDVLFVNSALVITQDGVALGNIYLTRDNTDVGGNGIPDDITKIEAIIPIGHGITQQAIYRLPLNFEGGAEYLGGIIRIGGAAGLTGIEIRLKYHPYEQAALTFETWVLGEVHGVSPLDIPFSVLATAGSILWVSVKTNGTNNVKVSGVFYLTLLKV